MLDTTKKWTLKTYPGAQVEIFCTDMVSTSYPVLGRARYSPETGWFMVLWNEEGRSHKGREYDLVPVKWKPEQNKPFWIVDLAAADGVDLFYNEEFDHFSNLVKNFNAFETKEQALAAVSVVIAALSNL